MRRRHRRLVEAAELDITTFMNLMIVLVPVLLINMVFSQTSVLDMNFPIGRNAPSTSDQTLQLQVVIQSQELLVSDSQGGLIKAIPRNDGKHDYPMLQLVMKDLKARLPDQRAITILPAAETSYQTLVTVMDTVRSYKAVVAGSLVAAELFPDISIADAPQVQPGTQEGS